MAGWWHSAVVYQIYPRSFADSNGDGVGDLPGIITRLDYLQDLGIDAIWLSPFYPSPQVDCGYDVADYTDVDPEYGTLDDFRRLLTEAHRRGIRVAVDLVLNHTSDRHPWFVEGRAAVDSPKRDWYVWHPGREGGPPNNWQSTFGGPAWEHDPATDHWYYHFFFPEQPDLNWHNPDVRSAMWEVGRFWLDLGVDGFRLDAIGTLFEDPSLADHQSRLNQAELLELRMKGRPYDNEEVKAAFYAMFGLQVDQPGVHEVFRELRRVVDEYDDRLLLGETGRPEYYGDGTDELHMVFNFPLMETARLTPAWVRANQRRRRAELPAGARACNTLGNHDRSRMLTRYGDGDHDEALARLHLAMLLTLPGTPVLYNGEEIGMADLALAEPDQFRDGISTWVYRTARTELGLDAATALDYAVRAGRDKCRTPLQWADAPHAGFCPPEATPWLPVHPNYASGVNVDDQRVTTDSMLAFYRRMLAARRMLPMLIDGDFEEIDGGHEDVLAYRRRGRTGQAVVALNFAARPTTVVLDAAGRYSVAFSTHPDRDGEMDPARLHLGPHEALVATDHPGPAAGI